MQAKSFVSSKLERYAAYSLTAMLYLALVRETSYYFSQDTVNLNPIDYIFFVVSIPFLAFGFLKSPKMVRTALITLCFFALFSGIISQYQLASEFDPPATVKALFPIAFLLVGINSGLNLGRRQLLLLGFSILSLAVIAAVRLFGINSALQIAEIRHSTAYLLLGLILILFVSRFRMSIKITLFVFLLSFLVQVNVATALIGLLTFLSFQVASYSKLGVISRMIMLGLGATLVVLTRVDIFRVRSGELGLLGSGRVAAWESGLESFAKHDLYTQLFGQGAGSSFQFWGVWWWAQKDIHSDFLRILIENGFLVLLIVVACFTIGFFTAQTVNSVTSSLLASALITSLISNGVLGRPYAALLWVLAAVLASRKTESGTIFQDTVVFERRVRQKV